MIQKRLLKFVDAGDNQTVYIDPLDVTALKELKPMRHDPNGISTFVGTSSTYGTVQSPDAMTLVYLKCGHFFQLTEHIAVVTAKLQGIDSSPAEVIFGKP